MITMDYKKQYTDHFNKVGGADAARLISDYEKNTKGLDQATAFKALEGGKHFGVDSDRVRYDALMNKQSEAKDRAQQHLKTSGGNNTEIKNTQELNVQQSNPQSSTINGDDNYVYQSQDNSVRNYGGDNRSFVYNAGKGKGGVETPATQATLSGFYDVDDSPAAQAKFLDLHTTLNRDNQKRYANTSHIAQGAIKRADQNSTMNTNALDKRIFDREQYSRAKADVLGMNLFGDMYNMKTPDWKSPERQTEVEKPDFESMYDKYTDF